MHGSVRRLDVPCEQLRIEKRLGQAMFHQLGFKFRQFGWVAAKFDRQSFVFLWC